MPVPFTFATATSAIPLSQLDSNFATTITLGNTAIQLGNTVTTLNNMTLANVTISGGGSFTSNSISTSGNLTFTSTGNRILGDFTNATVSSRTIVQTSTANSSTGVYAIPSGTSTAASWQATNNSDPTNASKILIATNGSTDVQLVSGINGTGTYLPMTFYNNGSEKMRLDTSGNLGIGTTSAIYKTQINSNGSQLRLDNSGGGQFTEINWASAGVTKANCYWDQVGTSLTFGTDTSAPLVFKTNTSERMRIDSSGNVGIGTSPTGLLDVKGNTNGAVVQCLRNDSTGAFSTVIYQMSAGSRYVNQTVSYPGQFIQLVGSSIPTIFLDFDTQIFRNTAGTERMRIDSSGNLLVGTTTNTGTARAQFAFSSGNGIGIQNNIGSAANGMIFHYGASSVGSITINTTATSFNTTSDYRLKETIEPMTGALAKVAALKPVTYKWKVDGSDGEGFIAHELAEVCPHAVTSEKDAVDAEGNPVYQGIDTSFLVATLTAAIQEQQAMIEELKAKVAKLEGAK